MDLERTTSSTAGFPEFTELGKRLEMLRIRRGLSKQHLARHAGTSRQQLWRVMTGKSELTAALKLRLAEVLNVQADELVYGASAATRVLTTRGATTSVIGRRGASAVLTGPRTLRAYLDSAPAIARTLETMPAGRDGRALKRRLLDALEDVALASGRPPGIAFFELRRRVLSDEL
jgi:transcriptional regulator with XRE-family HTH domain